MFCKKGTEIVRPSRTNAEIDIIRTDRFFSRMTDIKLLVFESEASIRKIFPMIRVENAIALTSPGVCPSLMDRKYTTTTIVSNSIPFNKLEKSFCHPKNNSSGFRGGLFMMPCSSCSDSKAMAHTGSMISSKNTICKGINRIGRKDKNAGKSTSPMIGM
jgi:hypothetical protein